MRTMPDILASAWGKPAGMAIFRVIVFKPQKPAAALEIAELLRRHAVKRGLMK